LGFHVRIWTVYGKLVVGTATSSKDELGNEELDFDARARTAHDHPEFPT